jgi:hypothetical protein
MSRRVVLALMVVAAWPARAATETEVFHGWSKDGTWYVLEERGANELVELYFCATGEAKPTWPAVLNELEREDSNARSCVHFLDPNKAPYQWKLQLVLPPVAWKGGGLEVLKELVVDGESPGFVLSAGGDKTQVCYATALRESSKLQKTWFHPQGKYVAAMIDGAFSHCVVTLKPGKAPPGKPPAPPPHKR